MLRLDFLLSEDLYQGVLEHLHRFPGRYATRNDLFVDALRRYLRDEQNYRIADFDERSVRS